MDNVEGSWHSQLWIPPILLQLTQPIRLLARVVQMGRPPPDGAVGHKVGLGPGDGKLEQVERGAWNRTGDRLLDEVQGPHLAQVGLQQQVEQRGLAYICAACQKKKKICHSPFHI